MANNPSALKRWRQSLVRRARNKPLRTRARSADKSVRNLLEAHDAPAAADAIKAAQAALDSAAQKGVIHKNLAARRKSRLMKQLVALQKAAPAAEAAPAAPKRRRAAAAKKKS